jgi:hypothetical protein
MDDFRVSPTSPDNPFKDEGNRSKKRKKEHPHEAAEQEDVVSLHGQTEAADEPAEDFYSPSTGTEPEE